jgi:GNAT superfamily N-acetyltransferase
VALCEVNKKIVGACTAIPLKFEEESFKQPFHIKDYAPSEICYYGESVLLLEFRGLGIGKAFMEAREKFARSLPGIKIISFCAVMRPADHPRRPADYKPLDGFWEKIGFRKVDGLTTKYSWKDLDEASETEKTMQFWMKKL